MGWFYYFHWNMPHFKSFQLKSYESICGLLKISGAKTLTTRSNGTLNTYTSTIIKLFLKFLPDKAFCVFFNTNGQIHNIKFKQTYSYWIFSFTFLWLNIWTLWSTVLTHDVSLSDRSGRKRITTCTLNCFLSITFSSLHCI